MEKYDKIIIGAGFYGLYAALTCGERGERVLVLECESAPFRRATYINQARVHQGYHYPRSLSTAERSAGYFARFNRDYSFCIHREFNQVYATSARYSWTDGRQFEAFCRAAGIPCRRLAPENYFREEMCDGAFMTREYTYDAAMLRDWYLDRLSPLSHVTLLYGADIAAMERDGDAWEIRLGDGRTFRTGFVLSAAYASTNQILQTAGFEGFRIKYELCEIILCEVNEALKDYGFTVMDGPFFSIMPLRNLFSPAAGELQRLSGQTGNRFSVYGQPGPEIPAGGIRFFLSFLSVFHEACAAEFGDRRFQAYADPGVLPEAHLCGGAVRENQYRI